MQPVIDRSQRSSLPPGDRPVFNRTTRFPKTTLAARKWTIFRTDGTGNRTLTGETDLARNML